MNDSSYAFLAVHRFAHTFLSNLILLQTKMYTDTDLRIKTLVLHECPLWKNQSIGRELNQEGIRMVMDDFVRSGHGEWEDPGVRTRCRILWRKPEQLASDIYDWAVANGYINSVCTVYELHSGEFAWARLRIFLLISFVNYHRLILSLSALGSEPRGGCERYVISWSG